VDLLCANEAFSQARRGAPLGDRPRRQLAVLTCMDVRIDIHGALGLRLGDAHEIRNAGGLATDDAIRSLIISVNQLGTRAILVVEHTNCGLLGLDEEAVRHELAERTGVGLAIPLLSFTDLEGNLQTQVDRLRSQPWLADISVEGLIYDTDTGRLSRPGLT
jgi:carbonic anhydrase